MNCKIITKLRLLLVVLPLLQLASCTRDETIADEIPSLPNLAVSVNSLNSNDENEKSIESVRLVVVGVKGSPNIGKVTCNQYFTKADIGENDVIHAKAKSGMSDVYLIANEPADIKTTMDGLQTVEDLEKVEIIFPETPTVGGSFIPMMRRFEKIDIMADPSKNVIGSETESIERLWTKINIRFRATDAEGSLNLAGMTIKSVKLCNIPKYSYWNAKPYNGDHTEEGAMVTDDAVLEVGTNTSTYSFYTPEYIGATELKHSYLVITATKDNREYTYRFHLGHSVADGNYDLLRNTFYNITATVKGFGETDVDVKISVLPWNYVPLKGNDGGYVRLNSIMIGTKEFTDGTKLGDEEHEISVKITTNCGMLKGELLVDGKSFITNISESVTEKRDQVLTFKLPANVTTNEFANVKNLQLIVTHPSVPIMSDNINIGSEHILEARQSVMIIQNRNIGAISDNDQGSLFQFYRPHAFGKSGNLTTYEDLQVYGPVSNYDATTKYQNYFITAQTKDPGIRPYNWNNESLDEWKGDTNPCSKAYGLNWKLPSQAEANRLLILLNKVRSGKNDYSVLYIEVGDQKIPIPFPAWLHPITGKNIEAIDIFGRMWTREYSTAYLAYAWGFNNGDGKVTPHVMQESTSFGLSIRCIKTID